MASSRVRWLVVVTVVVHALLLVPNHAFGHGNVLESMDPTDGSTVAEPIEQVVLTYSQPPGIQRVEVVSPDGSSTGVRPRALDERVIVPFTPDRAGRWMLRWTVVQTDGHAIEYERSLQVAPSAVPRIAGDDVRDSLEAAWARMLDRLVSFV